MTDILTTLTKTISNYHPNVCSNDQHSTFNRYLFMTQPAEHQQFVFLLELSTKIFLGHLAQTSSWKSTIDKLKQHNIQERVELPNSGNLT